MRLRNHCCRGKVVSITHYECVFVDLVIQHAKRMHCVVSPMASLAPPHFYTLSHKRCDFQENVAEHKMCVLIFSTTFI